jgi:hypothetical protein
MEIPSFAPYDTSSWLASGMKEERKTLLLLCTSNFLI